jgi:hypothetical protein
MQVGKIIGEGSTLLWISGNYWSSHYCVCFLLWLSFEWRMFLFQTLLYHACSKKERVCFSPQVSIPMIFLKFTLVPWNQSFAIAVMVPFSSSLSSSVNDSIGNKSETYISWIYRFVFLSRLERVCPWKKEPCCSAFTCLISSALACAKRKINA